MSTYFNLSGWNSLLGFETGQTPVLSASENKTSGVKEENEENDRPFFTNFFLKQEENGLLLPEYTKDIPNRYVYCIYRTAQEEFAKAIDAPIEDYFAPLCNEPSVAMASMQGETEEKVDSLFKSEVQVSDVLYPIYLKWSLNQNSFCHNSDKEEEKLSLILQYFSALKKA